MVKQQHIYLIGIGGIGMSALARYYKHAGAAVSGYDKTKTALTHQLESEGITIHYEDNVDAVDVEATLVIYTPAIPSDHKELNWYKEHKYNVLKRSEVLGQLSQNQYTIAIAGTHGKTTTSAMLAYILKENNVAISAFLGGVLSDYKSNFIAGGDKLVVEADEYDRSFLTLKPDVAAIMSLDADHLDIYGDHNKMISGFRDFTKKIKRKGLLLMPERFTHLMTMAWQNDLKRLGVIGLSFSADSVANIAAHKIEVVDGWTCFDYQAHENYIEGFKMKMPGLHNIENALVAITIAIYEGVPVENIKSALLSFNGISRRFERIVEANETVYVDDYAHHPTEIKAVVSALRNLYPSRKLTGVFQPHLYTRTRDFASEFAAALNLLDEVVLLDIYPAREEAIDGVSSQLILEGLDNGRLVHKEDLVETLAESKLDVLITLGAGDIDALVPDIKDMILNG